MRALILGGAVALLCASPTLADSSTVTFSGTLGSSCALSVTTPGTLALAADGKSISSQATGGIPAVLAIVSVGSNTVSVAPPTLTASPAGYSASGQTVQVAYAGLSGLSGVNQVYTSSTTTFGVTLVSALQVNNKVTNDNGFAPGTYTTQTVVTCGS